MTRPRCERHRPGYSLEENVDMEVVVGYAVGAPYADSERQGSERRGQGKGGIEEYDLVDTKLSVLLWSMSNACIWLHISLVRSRVSWILGLQPR